MKLAILGFFYFFAVTSTILAQAPEGYIQVPVGDWKIYMNKKIASNEILKTKITDRLQVEFYLMVHNLPDQALKTFTTIPIWIEDNDPMCDPHHDARYIPHSDNKVDPKYLNSIEICNAQQFIQTRTSSLNAIFFHEFAHAYHYNVLGEFNSQIKKAFDKALLSHKYDSVLNISGRRERAYALNNQYEYFAELSQAFFNVNDTYPFVRAELKEIDPEMFNVIETAWYHPEQSEKENPYTELNLEGWQFHISNELSEAKIRPLFITTITNKLNESISNITPEAAAILKSIPIWVDKEISSPLLGPVNYHPSDKWLLNNNFPTQWARSIEIPSASKFLNELDAHPGALASMLADAYNDRKFGYRNTDMDILFDKMKKKEKFQAFLRKQNITSSRKLFVMLSTAYLSKADEQPLSRDDLKTFDDEVYSSLKKIWGQSAE